MTDGLLAAGGHLAGLGIFSFSAVTGAGPQTAAFVGSRRRIRVFRRLRTAFLFFEFDPAILKPNFDLFLGQAQIGGDFDSSQTRQVLVAGEFPLQFQELGAREGGANSF